jgi:hypothetical protein
MQDPGYRERTDRYCDVGEEDDVDEVDEFASWAVVPGHAVVHTQRHSVKSQ